MAGRIDIFNTVAALRKIMATDMAAALNVIDAVYNDEITLDDIAEIRMAPVLEHESLPALIISGLRTEQAEEFREVSSDAAPVGNFVHYCQFHFIIVGSEGLAWTDPFSTSVSLLPVEVLAIRVSRTVEAAINVLTDNQTLQISSVDYADQVFVDEVDFSDVYVSEDDAQFRQDALIGFRVLCSV